MLLLETNIDSKSNVKTCIPEGTYPVEFRTVGGFDAKYTKRYGADFHKGMLWIRGVPEFEYILIHANLWSPYLVVCRLVKLNKFRQR